MMRVVRTFSSLLLLAILSGAPVDAAKKKKDQPADEAPGTEASITVDRWLLLGPVADPPPVFHDAARGGYDLAARLESDSLPGTSLLPREGTALQWSADEVPAWTARTTVGPDLV